MKAPLLINKRKAKATRSPFFAGRVEPVNSMAIISICAKRYAGSKKGGILSDRR